MTTILQDVRYALRMLARTKGFTAVAVLTLALGIGANTAVYTVVHSVLLAPLPFASPDRVVVLNEVSPQFPNPISVSWLNYLDWRDRSRSFAQVGAVRTLQMTLTGRGDAERLPVRMATASLPSLLGVDIPLGRWFTDTDDRAGAPGVAVISHALWLRRFGGQATAVGQRLELDKQGYTIVGVLPASFELFQPADVYVPIAPWAATLPDDRGWHPGILPVARLRDDVTLAAARDEMDAVATQLASEHPQFNRGVSARVTPIADVLVQNVRPALLMLLGAVALVLLIACANVANLLLTRAVGRRKEIAVRTAVGGSRGRIVRQLVVESVALACLGGAVGVLLASSGVSVLMTTVTGLPRAGAIDVDGPVLMFATALSVLTGLIFGTAPALQATRFDLREALNDEGRGSGSGGMYHHRLRRVLVVAEVAVALVLLVGAGVMLRSLAALQRVEPGFDAGNLLVIDLPLSPVTYREDSARTMHVDRLLERIQALPGAERAGVTTSLPMMGAGASIYFNVAGRPPRGPEEYALAGYRAVTPGYFGALGVRILRGRGIDARDREGAPRVAVINDSMARQFFADRNPLGERIGIGTEADAETAFFEIVGVVSDVKQSFETGARAEYYLPYAQYGPPVLAGLYRNPSLVLRTSGDPVRLASSVRAAVAEIDRDQPLVNIRTMEQAIGNTVAQPRLQATLLTLFASVALSLALVGVYGVMAYVVSQRTHEIGMRVALGASRADVVRLIVGEGVRLAAAGILVGLAGAAVATRAIESLLFETRPLDPPTFAIAAVLLGLTALVASYLPARRAASLPPSLVLNR